MIGFEAWWKAHGFEDKACPYTKFAIAKKAWEKVKEEMESESPSNQVDEIIMWRDAVFKEFEKERQDVLALQNVTDNYKDGVLEGLRLANIIVKLISDDACFKKAS